MKKMTIILVTVLFVALLSSKAQQSIFVEDVGGNISETPLSNVRKIIFSGTDMLLLKTDGSVLTWATTNVQKYYYAPTVTTQVNDIKITSISCQVYPNPSKGNFSVDYQLQENEDIIFSIFTLEGQEIETRIINNTSFEKQTINFNTSLVAGTYIIKIQSGKNLLTKKIIILK